MRAYLHAKGERTDGVTVRALVPVNLRPMEKAYKLGNQFGLVFLDLPIGLENPVERLYAVRANMDALKGRYQPVLALHVQPRLGLRQPLLERRHDLVPQPCRLRQLAPPLERVQVQRDRRRARASPSGSPRVCRVN